MTLAERLLAIASELQTLAGELAAPSPVIAVTPATLQATIDAGLKPGAILELEASADYGPIVLRGDVGVTMRSAADGFATIRATTGAPAMLAGDGAANWTIVGVEIIGHPDSNNQTVSFVGTSHDLTIDRCYVHGDSVRGAKVGIALNSGRASVINSTVVDFKRAGQDTQGIGGTQGPGPYLIENNLIEAAGENILFGGDDPKIDGLVPSDITIRGNTIRKPLDWRPLGFQIKNLIELKNARRVVIEDNELENCWGPIQNGYAIVLTPRNQGGKAPWSTVEDVTIQRNVIRHVGGWLNLLAIDNLQPSGRLTDVRILDNRVEDVDASLYGPNNAIIQSNGVKNLELRRNLVAGTHIKAALGFYGVKHEGLVVDGNTFPEGTYGIAGAGTGQGIIALEAYAPGYVWTGNTMIKTQTVQNPKYPAGTIIQTAP